MIIRVLGRGQYVVPESSLDLLNASDDKVQRALEANDQDALTAALSDLIKDITAGDRVADDYLGESDLVVPAEDATLDDLRAMLQASGATDGLIPG